MAVRASSKTQNGLVACHIHLKPGVLTQVIPQRLQRLRITVDQVDRRFGGQVTLSKPLFNLCEIPVPESPLNTSSRALTGIQSPWILILSAPSTILAPRVPLPDNRQR